MLLRAKLLGGARLLGRHGLSGSRVTSPVLAIARSLSPLIIRRGMAGGGAGAGAWQEGSSSSGSGQRGSAHFLQLPLALVATVAVVGTGLARMDQGVDLTDKVVPAPTPIAVKPEKEVEKTGEEVVVVIPPVTIWQLIASSKADILFLIGATLATIMDALVGMETPRAVGQLIQACYAVVTLLLHCCYTVVTLSLYCFCTVVRLLSHCCCTVVALSSHCHYTAVALMFHCCYTVIVLSLHELLHFCHHTVLLLSWHSHDTFATLLSHCCSTINSFTMLRILFSFQAMSSGINPVLPLGLGPIPYISLLFVVLFFFSFLCFSS
jgi:hypothetical protein